ncbi:MAG: hypothetical protein JKX85_05215 [Phycisphaeraceae bacterium]|nr:hypothetical protein [Phycisphaeraceae bacterium]
MSRVDWIKDDFDPDGKVTWYRFYEGGHKTFIDISPNTRAITDEHRALLSELGDPDRADIETAGRPCIGPVSVEDLRALKLYQRDRHAI